MITTHDNGRQAGRQAGRLKRLSGGAAGRAGRRGLYLSVYNTALVLQCTGARAPVRLCACVRVRERPADRVTSELRSGVRGGPHVHSILQQSRSGCLFSACGVGTFYPRFGQKYSFRPYNFIKRA